MCIFPHCKEVFVQEGWVAKRGDGDNFPELTAFTQPWTYTILLDQKNNLFFFNAKKLDFFFNSRVIKHYLIKGPYSLNTYPVFELCAKDYLKKTCTIITKQKLWFFYGTLLVKDKH